MDETGTSLTEISDAQYLEQEVSEHRHEHVTPSYLQNMLHVDDTDFEIEDVEEAVGDPNGNLEEFWDDQSDSLWGSLLEEDLNNNPWFPHTHHHHSHRKKRSSVISVNSESEIEDREEDGDSESEDDAEIDSIRNGNQEYMDFEKHEYMKDDDDSMGHSYSFGFNNHHPSDDFAETSLAEDALRSDSKDKARARMRASDQVYYVDSSAAADVVLPIVATNITCQRPAGLRRQYAYSDGNAFVFMNPDLVGIVNWGWLVFTILFILAIKGCTVLFRPARHRKIKAIIDSGQGVKELQSDTEDSDYVVDEDDFDSRAGSYFDYSNARGSYTDNTEHNRTGSYTESMTDDMSYSRDLRDDSMTTDTAFTPLPQKKPITRKIYEFINGKTKWGRITNLMLLALVFVDIYVWGASDMVMHMNREGHMIDILYPQMSFDKQQDNQIDRSYGAKPISPNERLNANECTPLYSRTYFTSDNEKIFIYEDIIFSIPFWIYLMLAVVAARKDPDLRIFKIPELMVWIKTYWVLDFISCVSTLLHLGATDHFCWLPSLAFLRLFRVCDIEMRQLIAVGMRAFCGRLLRPVQSYLFALALTVGIILIWASTLLRLTTMWIDGPGWVYDSAFFRWDYGVIVNEDYEPEQPMTFQENSFTQSNTGYDMYSAFLSIPSTIAALFNAVCSNDIVLASHMGPVQPQTMVALWILIVFFSIGVTGTIIGIIYHATRQFLSDYYDWETQDAIVLYDVNIPKNSQGTLPDDDGDDDSPGSAVDRNESGLSKRKNASKRHAFGAQDTFDEKEEDRLLAEGEEADDESAGYVHGDPLSFKQAQSRTAFPTAPPNMVPIKDGPDNLTDVDESEYLSESDGSDGEFLDDDGKPLYKLKKKCELQTARSWNLSNAKSTTTILSQNNCKQ